MGFKLDALREGARAAAVSFDELGREDTTALRERIVKRFFNGKDEWPVWEKMNGPSVQDEDAWRWLVDLNDQPIQLVFNKDDEGTAVLFPNSQALVSTLDESARVEFYICNVDITYLVCFNHHGYLIAIGDAAPWLTSRIRANDPDRQEPALSPQTPMNMQEPSDSYFELDDVRVWVEQETSIHMKAATSFGDPVELTEEDARGLARALLRFADSIGE